MKEWKVIQAKPSAFRFPQGVSFKELEKRIETRIQTSETD